MATTRQAPIDKSISILGYEDLQQRMQEYLPAERQKQVGQAYEFAVESHQGQLRKSGEPYVQHPLQAACLVADLKMDSNTLCAALLHDVVEDCGVSLDEIQRRFNADVCKLVDGVTKLSRIEWTETELGGKRRVDRKATAAENLRKMLLAMAEDIRVVIIKLADRLHNMRTLQALPPDRRVAIARETMEIYAPLASRLGIWQFKWELEDLSYRYIEPERYKEIARSLASTRATREGYIAQVTTMLEAELKRAGIKAEVSGRPKHIFSIAQKTDKYASQGRGFHEIYDILALRVLVESVNDCYSALGIVHNIWKPVPGTFDDYISMPKDSGYQSLHTTVMAMTMQPLEVQIRSYEMHQMAEYGIAAHWRYKEHNVKQSAVEERLTWLRQLLEWQRELQGAEEFMESVKTDLFSDRVFVYTPKGEIKDLPAGATPIDFAYRVHTDLGHRCIGAKVNSRLVALNLPLKTGDVVEIVAGKTERGPRLDWLNPHLGYVNTSHAREKIRGWFRRAERAENIERGRDMLKRELSRLGLVIADVELSRLFKFDSVDDLYAAMGCGDINSANITAKVAASQDRAEFTLTPATPAPTTTSKGIRVMGVGDLLTRLASCCHPVPGDEVIGYITRMRGVTVHRRDCKNILHEDETDRLIPVDWGAGNQLYSVPVRITALDRVGLLRDIASTVSAEGINIVRTYQSAQPDGTAVFQITLETTGMEQLSKVLAKLESVAGVSNAIRIMDGSAPA